MGACFVRSLITTEYYYPITCSSNALVEGGVIMDLRNMSDENLKEELKRASDRLSVTETEYVEAQNACSALESEYDRRMQEATRGPERVNVEGLITKWLEKANDIQRAADASVGDPKSRHSLITQADLVHACVSDLEKLLEDNRSKSSRT